jgi:hypothetical protein
MGGKEMIWSAFVTFADSLPSEDGPIGLNQYLKKDIDDYGLYENANEIATK